MNPVENTARVHPQTHQAAVTPVQAQLYSTAVATTPESVKPVVDVVSSFIVRPYHGDILQARRYLKTRYLYQVLGMISLVNRPHERNTKRSARALVVVMVAAVMYFCFLPHALSGAGEDECIVCRIHRAPLPAQHPVHPVIPLSLQKDDASTTDP